MDQNLKSEIRKCTDILQQGGIILYHTDTVWGIGCDATNNEAVERIFRLKRREDSKSMLVLLDDPGKIQSYASMPDIAIDLLEAAVRPMTILDPEARNLASGLITPEKTIGIRITEELFSKELVRTFKKPIVSTSANISGEPAPAFYDEISDEIKEGVDYIVGYRREERIRHTPSSIIRLGINGEIKIIRK